MARKKRKMDRKQFAEAIQESEAAIKMIENKELPDDASKIIAKIEQYFGIKLKKETGEGVFPKKEQKAEIKEMEQGKRELSGEKEQQKQQPAVVLKFDKETTKNITLSDLQRMKKERERIEAIEKAGVAAILKKELNVSELVWKGKQEEKEKKEVGKGNLAGNEIEIEDS